MGQVLPVILILLQRLNNSNKIWTQISHSYLRSWLTLKPAIILYLILTNTMKITPSFTMVWVLAHNSKNTVGIQIVLTCPASEINHCTSTTVSHLKAINNNTTKVLAFKFHRPILFKIWDSKKEAKFMRCRLSFSIIINFRSFWETTQVTVFNSMDIISCKATIHTQELIRIRKSVII